MKLKTKYAAGMRDELEGLLGCPVEVVEDREVKCPCIRDVDAGTT